MELALVLPVVALLALAVVQVALVARDQVLVIHAAREAARSAAVDGGHRAAERAAVSGSGLDPDRLRVEVGHRGPPGTLVQVRVRYRAPTQVPLVGPLVGEVRLGATAAMRVER